VPRANSGARSVRQCLASACTSHCRPALYLHTPLQLLSARVPVQTLTEHELKRECRALSPNQNKEFLALSIGRLGF
jgi:hypothetical protein